MTVAMATAVMATATAVAIPFAAFMRACHDKYLISLASVAADRRY